MINQSDAGFVCLKSHSLGNGNTEEKEVKCQRHAAGVYRRCHESRDDKMMQIAADVFSHAQNMHADS